MVYTKRLDTPKDCGVVIVRCKGCKKVFEKAIYKNVKWSGTRISEFTPQELYDFKFIVHKCREKNNKK